MGILDNPSNIIRGVKPVQKNRPKRHWKFDKSQPLGPYNYPTFSYAVYRIFGYKTDAAGLKHPVSWTERLPMGQRIRFKKDDYPGITITGCKRAIGGPIL